MNIARLFLPRLDHHQKAFGCRRSFVFFPRADVFELGSDLAGFQSLEGPDFRAGSTHTEVLRGEAHFRCSHHSLERVGHQKLPFLRFFIAISESILPTELEILPNTESFP
jgi:hypothetical protein